MTKFEKYSLVILVIELLATSVMAVLMYRMEKKVNLIDEESFLQQTIPKLYISHLYVKKDRIDTKHLQAGSGEAKASFERKGQAYIESLTAEQSLVSDKPDTQYNLTLNMLENESDIRADRYSTEIVLKNKQALLTGFQINKVIVHMTTGPSIELKGEAKTWNCNVDHKEELRLWISVVTNLEKNTLCRVAKIRENPLFEEEIDILTIPVADNFLEYNQLEVYATLVTEEGEEYRYDIIVENKNNQLSSRVERLE